MKWQRNIFQTNEQDKTPEEQLSELEIGNDRQSIWKTIQGNDSKDDPRSWKRMEAQTKKIQEMFNKELEDLKNKQMNNTIIEMKNTLEWINSRINETEEQISELKEWWESLPQNSIKKEEWKEMRTV